MTPDVPSRFDAEAAKHALLEEAEDLLASTTTPATNRPLRRGRRPHAPRDLDEVIRQLDRRIRELQVKLDAALQIRLRADELEATATSADVVVKRLRRELSEAFETDPFDGGVRWFDGVTELLATWNLDALGSLVEGDGFPFAARHAEDAVLVREGVAALSGDVRRALPMIEVLADQDSVDQTTDRARLLTLGARIHLYELHDADAAQQLLDRARSIDRGCAVALAARGEVFRSIRQIDDALRCFEESIRLSPGDPDGYTGLGLLAEDRAVAKSDKSAWDQAEYAYDSAVIAAGRGAVAGRLLAPAPANLHLQYARQLSRDHDTVGALAAYEQALALGIRGAGEHPDRRARKELARLLADANRLHEAADAFYEAGWRYATTDNVRQAQKLLERALECSPTHRNAHWFLADVLRVRSGRVPAGHARQEIVSTAIELWDSAYSAGPLSDSFAWVYPTRALLAEQRASSTLDSSVVCESLAYFERGLVRHPDNPWARVHLARQHRYLGLHANARAAVEAAAAGALDATTLWVLTEELLEQGDWEGARSTARQLTEMDRGVEASMVLARVLLCSDGPDAALAAALAALSLAPDNRLAREVAAHSSYLLGELDAAQEHAALLWVSRPTLDEDLAPGRSAWWGYIAGDLMGATTSFLHAIASGANRGAMLRDFGQVQLATGDLDEAERSLTEGIDSTSSALEARTMELELQRLESVASTWPHANGALAVVARAQKRLESRRTRLAGVHDDPIVEVEAALLDVDRSAEFRLAVQLTRARLLRERGLQRDSAVVYREVIATSDVPEAAIAVRQVVEAEVSLLLRKQIVDWPATATSIADLIDLVRPTIDDDEAFALRLLAPAVVIAVVVGDLGAARDRLSLAFGATAESARAVEAMTDAVVRLQVDDSVAWAIYDEMIVRSGRVAADEFVCSVISSVLGMAASKAAAQTTPIVDPAVLDLGVDLYPDGLDGSSFFQRLPPFYDRITNDTGVDIPAIPVVRVESLPPRSYAIKVDENRVAQGGHRLSDGEPGSTPSLDAVLDHLEAVLRGLLATFVGVSTIDQWLEAYVIEGGDPAVLDCFRADASVRVGFVRLLQSLVDESVPVIDRATIVDVVTAASFHRIDSLTDRVRQELSTSLVPSDHVARPAPAWLEDELSARCTFGDGDVRVPRATMDALIERLRSWGRALDAGTSRIVITTGRADLRVAMWCIASAALPNASVLLSAEASR